MARAGDGRSWLSGTTEPEAFVRALLRGKLLAGDAPFGVFGLAWGTWVDDDHVIPERMRGGGAPMLFPWQMGAEAMLLLTAHGERRQKGSVPILLTRDLPKR